MKWVTVVGARPQFIKAAAVLRAIQARENATDSIHSILVHTGQHHDHNLSNIFFEELGIPTPQYHLGIAGGTHGQMTGRMIEAIETVLLAEKPDKLLVYGDTNSTVAAALAAAKCGISIAHIEAGLRSFDRRMPEEINRILTDHVSKEKFCPTQAAIENLSREGITDDVYWVGDVMYDVARDYAARAESHRALFDTLGVCPKAYILVTCHREENTDNIARLRHIVDALEHIAHDTSVIFPLHPRTAKRLAQAGLYDRLRHVQCIPPVSYLEMVLLEKHAMVIVTDSGGVQKEAFFYRVPCVTLRDTSEWGETIALGWNRLVGDDPDKIVAAIRDARCGEEGEWPYGHQRASERIVEILSRERTHECV